MVARGAGGVRDWEITALRFLFFFRCKVFQQGRILLHEGGGGGFLSEFFGSIGIYFAMLLLCRDVHYRFPYIQHIKRRKKYIPYLEHVRMYVRQPAGRLSVCGVRAVFSQRMTGGLLALGSILTTRLVFRFFLKFQHYFTKFSEG